MSTWAIHDDSIGTLELDAGLNGLAVTSFDPGWPAHREVIEDNADASGEHDSTRFHGGRVVTLDVRIVGTPAERHHGRQHLVRYARPDLRPTIIWRSDHYGEVQSVGRIQSVSASIGVAMRPFTARLVQRVPSGLWQSTTLQSAVVRPGSGSAQTGRTYDEVYDRDYPTGVLVGAGTAILPAESAPVPPVIRIYGPVANPTFQLLTSGGSWTFTGNGGLTLGAAEYLEIDVAARTVYLNGDPTLTRYNYLDFATLVWAGLLPGANDAFFNGSSTDSNTNAVIEWRDSWL